MRRENVQRTKLNFRNKSEEENIRKDFIDMVIPSVVKFNVDHYICGNTYRCVWAIRDYPTETNEQAILRNLGESAGVTLRIYTRHVNPMEERKIIQNASSKNRMNALSNNNLQDTIKAETEQQGLIGMVSELIRRKEPLVHCAVFIEIIALELDELKNQQSTILAELTRIKISIDRLILRQREGFLSVHLCGKNVLGEQFERVLPSSSVANLYPLSYSCKTDPQGFYIGKDKYGSNIILDLDRRASDKTNSNVLILGNSGMGKSYLMKLLLINIRMSGKSIVMLDPEAEFKDIALGLGGCYVDLMSGEYLINVLEVKVFDETQGKKVLSTHISFLRDFFRAYKDFSDKEIDTIEIMLQKLYRSKGLSDDSDFGNLKHIDYPILSELYEEIEQEYELYEENTKCIYTREILQSVLLSLNSICVGAESNFFNGHTNIPGEQGQGEAKYRNATSHNVICFGVKEVMSASTNVKNAILFNILSYLSNELLTKGNTVASIDELYLFLSNITMVEYIRNMMKRVRKKESGVIIASQNIEDFNQPGIAELSKPLFSIPTHQFLFNGGKVEKKVYMELLQMEENEFEIIKDPRKGECLFRCGNERYHLCVKTLKHKQEIYGTVGGR